jgi:formylglycine-generating enzyme required for sulfatase activity
MLLPLRGGPWRITCRSAYRGRFQPGYVSKGFGFRVVCLPREEAP